MTDVTGPGEAHEVPFDAIESGDETRRADVQGPIVFVPEQVDHSWTGVASCCRPDRIQNEVRARWEQWRTAQQAAHPGMIMIRTGVGASTVTCHQAPAVLGQGRSCRASVSLPMWAEFAKPE